MYALVYEGSTVTIIDADLAAQMRAESTHLQGLNGMKSEDVFSCKVGINYRGVLENKEYRMNNATTIQNLQLPK